jgi:hypothetical protein
MESNPGAKIIRPSKRTCTSGVCDPQRTQGLRAPAPEGDHTLVTIKGPGVFVSAHVSKQGGNTGLTFVILDMDGRNVVNISYAAAQNLSYTQQNPYGLVLLGSGDLQNFTMGWPSPMRFERELKLSVKVSEPGIVQILANVIHGA